MKEFWELSNLGRIRRIGRLVRSTLQQYDLNIREEKVLCFATNPLFRVDGRILASIPTEITGCDHNHRIRYDVPGQSCVYVDPETTRSDRGIDRYRDDHRRC